MQNEQPVRITVSGIEDGQDSVSLTTQGVLSTLDDGWVLAYQETNPIDLSTIDTLVACTGTRVTVTRTGTLLSTIVFDEHETFVGEYITDYGSFQLRVYTSEAAVRRRGGIGHIHLVYQMSLTNSQSPSETMSTRHLDIRFTPCKA